MNASDQADCLAGSALVYTVVDFHCEQCTAVFSSRGNSVYAAARSAVRAGWRGDIDNQTLCLSCCASENMLDSGE